MKVRFDQVDQVGEELTLQSLEALAANINTGSPSNKSAIVIYNPLSFPRSDVANASIDLPTDSSRFDLLDSTGRSVPYQTRGQASRDLIHMTLDEKGFRSAFNMIPDGRAAGMAVQAIKFDRRDADVYIDLILAEGGEPNLPVWKSATQKVQSLLQDEYITTYHIVARTAPSTSIILAAQDVPPLGYQTLWVRPRSPSTEPVRMSPLLKALLPLTRLPIIKLLTLRPAYARRPYRLENEFFKVEALSSGTVTVFDKRTQATYCGLNQFQDGGDCGDEYNYAPPAADRFYTPRLKHVRKMSGPVQQSLELQMELSVPASLAPDRQSRKGRKALISLTTVITLTEGVSRIDIRTTLNNTARDHRLRVHFPAPFSAETANHDGHFEMVNRKTGIPPFDDTWIEQPRPEVPQRAFTDISTGQCGLTVANRGLPEVEILRGEDGNASIALTLLRCVGWLSRDDFSTRKGHAGPAMETPGAQMQGEWSFDYSIIPHDGNLDSASRQAYAFETPLRSAGTGLHEGSLPPTASFMETSPAEFLISTVKTAEDGRGIVVRGYNAGSAEMQVSIKPWQQFKKAELVNLAEEKKASLKITQDGSVTFLAGPHEIISVLFS